MWLKGGELVIFGIGFIILKKYIVYKLLLVI